MQIVKKYKQPVLIFESIEEQIMNLDEENKFNWQEIFELFHKPDVIDSDFDFKEVDEEKIKEILVERHDFSEERVEKQIEKLREVKEKLKQKDLDKWF